MNVHEIITQLHYLKLLLQTLIDDLENTQARIDSDLAQEIDSAIGGRYDDAL